MFAYSDYVFYVNEKAVFIDFWSELKQK